MSPRATPKFWESLAPFIKIGAMEDEKFADQVAELVLFGTTAAAGEGDSPDPVAAEGGKRFTTLAGYRSRLSADNDKRILYCTDEAGTRAPWRSGKGKALRCCWLTPSSTPSSFLGWNIATRN